jgi:hypothetical protein
MREMREMREHGGKAAERRIITPQSTVNSQQSTVNSY